MEEENINNGLPNDENWMQENAELDKIIADFQEKMKNEGFQL